MKTILIKFQNMTMCFYFQIVWHTLCSFPSWNIKADWYRLDRLYYWSTATGCWQYGVTCKLSNVVRTSSRECATTRGGSVVPAVPPHYSPKHGTPNWHYSNSMLLKHNIIQTWSYSKFKANQNDVIKTRGYSNLTVSLVLNKSSVLIMLPLCI